MPIDAFTPAVNWPEHPFLEPPQQSDEIGRFGRYRVLDILGRGGLSFIFRAEDVRLKREVALKVARPRSKSDRLKEIFIKGASVQAAIDHDNVTPVFDLGEQNGITFMTMPLLRGRTLGNAIKDDSLLPVAVLVRLAKEVAEGLAAVHARGFIHSDITPSNLWLDTSGKVRIFGFGLAHSVDEADPPGTVSGTPAYMSPEQAQGAALDSRTDLFSLGVVLYQLCTGRKPFDGSTLMDLLAAVCTHSPVPVTRVNPGVPESLAVLVQSLLEKKPEDRPARAEGVVRWLSAIERDLAPHQAAAVPALDSPAPKEITPVAHRTYEELAREIIELEKQFDLPEQDDIIADARWFEKQWGTPHFEPYRGTHIAVLNGAVVGHGWNSLQLQLDVARKFNVHPQRFIVEYIPPRAF